MNALTPREQTIALFAGVGVVLVVASLVGFALKRWVARGEPHGVIDNLNARVKAWWAMVAVIGIAFMAGRAGVTILFLVVSFAALREFLSLSYTRTGDHYALLASFFVVLPAQYLLIYTGWYGLYTIFIPVYVFLFLPILVAVAGDTTRFQERAANTCGASSRAGTRSRRRCRRRRPGRACSAAWRAPRRSARRSTG